MERSNPEMVGCGDDGAVVKPIRVVLSRGISRIHVRRKTEMSWRFTLLPDSAAQLPERSEWNLERQLGHQRTRTLLVSVKYYRVQGIHSVQAQSKISDTVYYVFKASLASASYKGYVTSAHLVSVAASCA